MVTKPAPNKTKLDLILAITLLLLSLLTFLPTLGITKIIDPSDGFFAETAREMLESRNFITPTLNYESWNDKPILNHWLVTLSYALFGVSEYASRIPAALCASITCVVTFVFSRIFLGRKIAFAAALMLLSSYLFQILGRVSLTDMPLTLFVNCGLFLLFTSLTKRDKRFAYAGWAALGLAFLTKGPICLLITFGAFLLYFLATTKKFSVSNLLSEFGQLGAFKGLAIVAALAAPWFAIAGITTHGRFLYDFFIVQNIQRASGALTLNHEQPFWFYIPILALAIFPFSALVPSLTPVLNKWWQMRHVQSLRIRFLFFCAAIVLTIFGGFSILKGKLPTYILPLLPSLYILLSAGICAALKSTERRYLLASAALALTASVAAFFVFPQSVEATGEAKHFAEALMVVYSITSLVFWLCVLQGKKLIALFQMTAVASIVSAILIPFVFVEFYEHHQLDYAKILMLAKQHKGTLSQVGDTAPSAPYYVGKQVPAIHTFFDLAATTAYPGEHYAIAKNEYDSFLSRVPIRKLIARSGEWSLYSLSDPKQELLNSYYTLDRIKNQAKLSGH
ncbi:MAG: hypothetical protein C0469_15060 [Cyanobacteria bacterium DS2.3.42]|nr:hypothetical protein [Cyanobacteria bacterium DS2.3.42]